MRSYPAILAHRLFLATVSSYNRRVLLLIDYGLPVREKYLGSTVVTQQYY